MGTILCATRGGEESNRTEEAAIEKAASGGDMLIFFYVVDVEFLAYAKYTLRSDVVHGELQGMAEFLLAMAVERAHKKHVKATALIRHGNFIEELVKAASEVGTTLVAMGRPDDEEAANALAAKIEELSLRTGIPFVILP